MLHNRSFNPTTNSSVTLFTKYEEIIIFFFKSVRTLFFISLFFHAQKNGSILDQIERFSWIFDTNTVLKITHYLLKMFFLNLKKKISKSDFQQLQLFLPFLSINSTHTCVRSFHEPVSVWKEDDTRPPDPGVDYSVSPLELTFGRLCWRPARRPPASIPGQRSCLPAAPPSGYCRSAGCSPGSRT